MTGETPPPAPRPFRWATLDSSISFFLLFGGIQAFIGALLFTVFTAIGGPFWNDLALAQRGVQAQAIPSAATATSARVNNLRVYDVSFAFTTQAGALTATHAETTDKEVIEHAQKHEPIAIDYDPNHPSVVRFAGQSASPFGLFVLIPLGMALVGAALLYVGMKRLRRFRGIYTNGEATVATVDSVQPTNMRVNNRTVLRVTYSFDSPIGRMSGSTTALKNPPTVGSELWVLFAVSDPTQNVAA